MNRWLFRPAPKESPPDAWADELAITPVFLKLLWRRGLRRKADIEHYLNAPLSSLTHPDQWPQIPQAARIIADGLLRGKRLAIWGDYDVDGITATAIVLDVLDAHGFAALHHLPDRRREGYGLNVRGVEELAASGCQILLTVDCGISNAEAVARARELGMTVVVSDHHLPPDTLPGADAIVNPRMADAGEWPCQYLAGAGVAFYLMAAVNILLAPGTGKRYKMDSALDLVALGTLADIMRLDGENRVLTRGGLARMAKNCRPGIAALKNVGGMNMAAELSSDHAVFRLAPRINAAGRMGSPELALRLLRARAFAEAAPLAEQLNLCNNQRQSEEKRIFSEAAAQAEEMLAKKDYAGLILYGKDWHPGIVGIVASRIVETFHRPAVALCQDGDSLKGSGRSFSTFDLHAGLAKVADCLIGFGGHRQAAGLRLKPELLPDLREKFNAVCRTDIGDTPPLPELLIEGQLDFEKAANFEFLRELQLMQPFGPGNEEPVFSSPPLFVRRRSPLGHSGEHVRLDLLDEKSGITLTARAWRMAKKLPPDIVGNRIQVAYTPRIDEYNGLPSIDVGIKDWRKLGPA